MWIHTICLSLSLSLFPWLAFIPRHFCSPGQPSHWLAVSLVGVKFISSSYQVCSIRHGQESCNLCNIYWRTEKGGLRSFAPPLSGHFVQDVTKRLHIYQYSPPPLVSPPFRVSLYAPGHIYTIQGLSKQCVFFPWERRKRKYGEIAFFSYTLN